jgi:LPXTG-motif cell wall-anchored protein
VYVVIPEDAGEEEYLMGKHTDLTDSLQTVAGEIHWELPETPPETPPELETETSVTTEDNPPETPEPPSPPNTPGPPDTPKTGDDTPVFPFIVLAVISLAGMIIVIRRRYKG